MGCYAPTTKMFFLKKRENILNIILLYEIWINNFGRIGDVSDKGQTGTPAGRRVYVKSCLVLWDPLLFFVFCLVLP